MYCHKRIAGAIEHRALDLSPETWVKILEKECVYSDRLVDLKSCRITELRHYRQTKGFPVHENIVCLMKAGEDERFICINRVPKEQPWSSSKSEAKKMAQDSSSSTDSMWSQDGAEITTGLESSTGDEISIISVGKLSDEMPNYDLVQTVKLPSDNGMTVLDVAALAAAISSSAMNYSLHHHMCWWFSAMFFKTAVASWHVEDRVKERALFRKQGKIFGFCIVKPDTCELVLPENSDYNRLVKKCQNAVRSRSQAETDEVQQITQDILGAMDRDTEQMKVEPISLRTIKDAFQKERKRLEQVIQQNIDDRYKVVREHAQLTEDIRKKEAELRRKDQELRKKDQELGKKDELIMIRQRELEIVKRRAVASFQA
ncbi:hypothetical protein C8R42DRAFT_645297 [Lentinula raphanica]|nr:hypothetical protein C8R42DRAFT_645297 [Lentinula raphanica]